MFEYKDNWEVEPPAELRKNMSLTEQAQYTADRVAFLLTNDRFINSGKNQLGEEAFYDHWGFHALINEFLFTKDAPMREVVEEFTYCFGPNLPEPCLTIVATMVRTLLLLRVF